MLDDQVTLRRSTRGQWQSSLAPAKQSAGLVNSVGLCGSRRYCVSCGIKPRASWRQRDISTPQPNQTVFDYPSSVPPS